MTALRDEARSPASPPAPGGVPKSEPSERVLRLWRAANCVCFDVDCTVAVNDQLDLLAEFMGAGEACARVTNAAMDGTTSLEAALEERLRIINCTPQPPKLVGFDLREPTGHQKGKVKAIEGLREMFPYEVVVMVGDGITVREGGEALQRSSQRPRQSRGAARRARAAPRGIGRARRRLPLDPAAREAARPPQDLEAVQETGGADLFIGYGGVVRRPAVMAGADWFVDSFSRLQAVLQRYQVAMIGSGAWACAAVRAGGEGGRGGGGRVRLVAQNTRSTEKGDKFVREVKMWVYEETLPDGRKLTDAINEAHENVKYLPGERAPAQQSAVPNRRRCSLLAGHELGDNVVACPDLEETGMRVRADGPQLISELIRKELGLDCSVLMGANIAEDIAQGELSEATIGYSIHANARVFQARPGELFETKAFGITKVEDVVGCEMAGTLKNIVALAAGFVEGLGLGPNTKAAIMRAGLNEMRRLSKAVSPTVRHSC
eukprot:scaffold12.g8019.t1